MNIKIEQLDVEDFEEFVSLCKDERASVPRVTSETCLKHDEKGFATIYEWAVATVVMCYMVYRFETDEYERTVKSRLELCGVPISTATEPWTVENVTLLRESEEESDLL